MRPVYKNAYIMEVGWKCPQILSPSEEDASEIEKKDASEIAKPISSYVLLDDSTGFFYK